MVSLRQGWVLRSTLCISSLPPMHSPSPGSVFPKYWLHSPYGGLCQFQAQLEREIFPNSCKQSPRIKPQGQAQVTCLSLTQSLWYRDEIFLRVRAGSAQTELHWVRRGGSLKDNQSVVTRRQEWVLGGPKLQRYRHDLWVQADSKLSTYVTLNKCLNFLMQLLSFNIGN